MCRSVATRQDLTFTEQHRPTTLVTDLHVTDLANFLTARLAAGCVHSMKASYPQLTRLPGELVSHDAITERSKDVNHMLQAQHMQA